MKELADKNFKLNERVGKFSKWVENTVGKGEIARYEQFLLFPQCFQKTCTADTLKPGLVWEGVNSRHLRASEQSNFDPTSITMYAQSGEHNTIQRERNSSEIRVKWIKKEQRKWRNCYA